MNKVLVITSIVTAATVLIYTVFAGLQWWAIRKQAEHTASQASTMRGQLDAMKGQEAAMRDQLVAMRDAIGQSKEQTQIAGDSLVTSNRSYVGIHSIADRQINDFEKMIFIKLENIGRVPADEIRVRVHLDWVLVSSAITNVSNVRSGHGSVLDKNFGRTKLFPGELKIEIPIPYSDHFSDDEITLIMGGQIHLTVWGHIIYKDGFGGGNKTEFAFNHANDGRWLIYAPWPEDIVQMIEEGHEDKEAHDPD